MRQTGRWTTPVDLCVLLVLLAILPACKSSTLGLPLAAANSQQTSTNETEIDALYMIVGSLFQTSAQQIAYGWLQGVDPCGTATCTNHTAPPCSWTGLSCNNWHVTGIDLDPATMTQPGMSSQPGGTISPYIIYLSSLRSLQLADQGMTGTVPRVLGLLSELQVVDLSNNVLTGFLPATYGLLTNLTTLNLRNNSIAGAVPPSWSNMTSLTSLNLQNNSVVCNTVPNIPKLVNPATHSITNPNLQFAPCSASVLAAQAAAAGNGSPSPTPAASPTPLLPQPAAASPVSEYRMSQGINVSVSVLVGICFLLGLCAGMVRIRQQRRRHQRLLAGINRVRRNRYDPNYSPDPDGDNHEVWLDLPPYPAADNPYCSTPRLVLGPDGQHLALARKLKQQAVVTDAKTSTAGATEASEQQAHGDGNSDLPEPISSPFSPLHPHISLYTAVLDVDTLHTTAPAAPLDLVSPSTAPATAPAAAGESQAGTPASGVAALQLDGSSHRQADEQQAASTSATSARAATALLGRLSKRLASQLPSSATQANAQHQQQGPSQLQPPRGSTQDLQAGDAAVSSRATSHSAVQEQGWSRRLPWPFHRAA